MDLGAITQALGGLLGGQQDIAAQQQGQQAQGQGQQGGFNPAVLAALLPLVMQFINSKGGIQGILEMFNKGGAGNHAKSWVADGNNAQVSPEQVKEALGPEVDRIAEQAGVPKEEAATGIAALMPTVIDTLTPGGDVPDQNDLSAVIGNVLGNR